MIILGLVSGDFNLRATTDSYADLLDNLKAQPIGRTTGYGSLPSLTVNTIIARFLESPGEWLQLLDSDMEFPATLTARLLARKKPLVGCTYRMRKPPYSFLGRHHDRAEITGSETGLGRMAYLPSGLLLIHRKVCEAVGWPWFFETYDRDVPLKMDGPDGNFCMAAAAKGFHPFCDFDLSRECSHVGANPIGWTHGRR